MAKIAFVQNLAFEYMGTMYLSSVLKQHSHQAEAFIGDMGPKMICQIRNYNPDLVGFSCVTGLHDWCLKAAREIKKSISAKIIFGGPHPTFFPDVINEGPVDIICRGEGEGAILDIADNIDRGSDYTKTQNCWFLTKSGVIKNDVRPLLEDLDSLPFPDRRIYMDKYPYLKSSQKVVFTGRGCPYNCTYCFNDSLKKIYNNKGKYVRKRSVDNILEEIDLLRAKERVGTIYFQDDVFFIDKNWLGDFTLKYSKKVNLPYICLVRVENIDEESVKLLKESNCKNVFFGIESGCEEFRYKLLKRHITDEQIVKAAALLKKYGIKFRTYNMLGLPGETREDAFKTVHLNTAIKADYPWCSLLYPYPGTEINSYAASRSLILDEPRQKSHPSFFKTSVISSSCRNELINLQKLFFYAVKFPRLEGLIKRLIKLSPNIIFDIMFLISYGWCYLKSENHRIREVISKGVRNVSGFYFKSG